MTLLQEGSFERMFTDDGDPEGPPGGWRITFPDGSRFVWEGFYTGPLTLSVQELRAIARELLGHSLDEVSSAAARELRPYVSDGAPVPSIVLHSATPVLRSMEADLSDAMSRRPPDDVATYVETRAVSLAGPGDLVVGRTHTWKVAADLAGVEAVTIPGIDYYYLSHAILKLAVDSRGRAPQLVRLVERLREQPRTLVRLYSLDRETQMVLLYLKRRAGTEVLYTDANSPEIADYWNTKAPLHPTVESALALDPGTLDPPELLAAETALSPLSTRLGLRIAVIPGYTVAANGPDEAVVTDRFLAAARLLTDRYQLRHGCLKPSEGGAGARILPWVPLHDEAELRRLAALTWRARQVYVLEAQVDYVRRQVGGRTVILAPSGHVRYGHVADGLTLQLTSGTSWQGNIYLDEATCGTLGLAAGQCRAMLQTVHDLHDAFTRHGLGLVTAGVDFAVGRVGGAFGDDVLTAAQDPNLSSHGAEYLRLFLDETRADGGPAYAATKVVCPTMRASLPLLRSLEAATTPGRRFKVISSVPGRWGMIAAAAESPVAAAEEVLACEKALTGQGCLSDSARRC